MTPGDKVKTVYGLALAGYWAAGTRVDERRFWKIVQACRPGLWLKPE